MNGDCYFPLYSTIDQLASKPMAVQVQNTNNTKHPRCQPGSIRLFEPRRTIDL